MSKAEVQGHKAVTGGTASTVASLTPAMRQYVEQKKRVGDAVLLFRMGDFYETFYEDAKTCSLVLGLTLTSRGKSGDTPIPLAGLPYHAIDGYLKKMIQAGFKVAVCEQVEDPKKAIGVVKRDVVRVVTPGTPTVDILLEAKENHFLFATSLAVPAHAMTANGVAARRLAAGCRHPPQGGHAVAQQESGLAGGDSQIIGIDGATHHAGISSSLECVRYEVVPIGSSPVESEEQVARRG